MTYDEYMKKYGSVGKKTDAPQDKQDSQGQGAFDRYMSKYKSAYEQDGGADFSSRFSRFESDYRGYMENALKDYQGTTYSNVGDILQSNSQRIGALREDASGLLRYLYAHEGSFDKEGYKAAVDYLTQVGYDLDHTMDAFGDQRRFYAQWDTEDAYNESRRQQEMLAADTAVLEKELADLQAEREDYSANHEFDWTSYQQRKAHEDRLGVYDAQIEEKRKYLGEASRLQSEYNQAIEGEKTRQQMLSADLSALEKELADLYAERDSYEYDWTDNRQRAAAEEAIGEFNRKISEKEQYLNQARLAQEGAALAGAVNNADFRDYSGYVSTKSDKWYSGISTEKGMGYDDLAYEYINNQNGIRDEIKQKTTIYDSDTLYASGESRFESKGYDYLTDEEIAIYNYHYAKDGKETAQKYLDSIQSALNARKAAGMREDMKDKTALQLLFGVTAGLDQFDSGIKGLFNTKSNYIPPSAVQIASGMIRDDLSGVGPELPDWMGGASLGQMGYDAITTTANMAPSMFASLAANALVPGSGAYVGNAVTFASTAGNAYQEALNLGYSKDQARTYSTLVGASEAGLQYLLGGIESLGGKVSGNVLGKMLDGVDNALGRAALELGGSMLSEGMEEGLQEIMTTWFQNLTLYADQDVNWEEVAYSSLLGALTSGFTEGGSTAVSGISNHAQNTQQGAAILERDGQLDALRQLANEVAGVSDAKTQARIAEQTEKVERKKTAGNVGRLYQTVQTARSQPQIAARLKSKGLSTGTADAIAEAVAAERSGQQLSPDQQRLLESAMSIEAVQEAVSGMETNTESPQTQTQIPEQISRDSAGDLGTAAEAAKVQRISKIEQGKASVVLKDGSEVSLEDAGLDPEESARIETIAGIEGISEQDANFILNTLSLSPEGSAEYAAHGAKEVYFRGFYGFPASQMNRGVFTDVLTEQQRQAIFETGWKAGQQQAAGRHGLVAGKGMAVNRKPGKVHYRGNRAILTQRQRASLDALKEVAKALGVQIYVFESKPGEDGKWTGDNGWYATRNSSIHVDLHAGANGEGTMLFAAAHELTHFIRQWSPEKFKVLADFLMEEYGKKVVDIEALIRAQMDKAKRNNRTISYDTAYEEVIADSMEQMLSDGRIMEKLAKLKAQDQSLWQKIKDYITELVGRIRSAYKGMSPDSPEGRHVAEMVEAAEGLLEKFQDAFYEGLVDAGENFRRAEKNTAGGGGVKFNLRDVDINRRFIDYSDNGQMSKAIDETVADLVKREKTVNIDAAIPAKYEGEAEWSDKKSVRSLLRGILDDYIGKTVHFQYGKDQAIAYLTREGINHSVGGPASSKKAAAFSFYYELIRKAEYSFSAKNDSHSNSNKRIGGKIDWDYFIAVAVIGKIEYPVIFKVRSTDKDTRSQIYEMATKNETGGSHGDGHQNKLMDVQPDYGVAPISNNMIHPDGTEVKKNSARDSESVSNRSLLANALESVAQTDLERKRIQEYKENIDKLNAQEQKLSDLKRQIKEKSFAKGPRDKAKLRELKDEAIHTANRIDNLDKKLLRLEAAKPLQDVLTREKEKVRKREQQKNKEAMAAYRETAERKYREDRERWQEAKKKAVSKVRETAEMREEKAKLQKVVLDTAKWIAHPAKTDVKCPDLLKQPYADFLNSIDMSSDRLSKGGDPTKNDLRLANAMGSLTTAIEKIMTSQDPSRDSGEVLDAGYLDLPGDFVQKLRDMTESVKAMMVEGEYVIHNMSAADVRKLSQMIRTLNHAIKEVSTLYTNLRFASVRELAADSMGYMDSLGEIGKTGGIRDFVQWENALPYYAFKRFGKGGESVFEGLMDAQDKQAFLAKEIFDFQEKTWKGSEAKKWSEDTHTIDLPDGERLTLTTADAMSIYCLSRRQQGMQHLLGGGVRVMGLRKGSKKTSDSRSALTVRDIDAIISTLTDRQKTVAEAMQKFMSTTCAEWGNEISMKRFLTREFNETNYFPIESNDENLPTKDPATQQSDLFRLLNISATKAINPRANNEVIIRNIFDVFSGHASDMARLNAYGMALLDYMKWLNYREKTTNENGQISVSGVRKSMEKAFGNAAGRYVLNLIKDVNGRPSDNGDPTILMKWMRSAKTASVGSSLRVATLQITSYPRAALVLSPKNLVLGLTKVPRIERAKKYCGIALWKSFGFYDTNISRSIEEQLKGVKNIKQKLIELSLKGAEWGDAITWGAMWNACEYEVAATKQYKVGSEEFYRAVGKKLREVVYRTQVVDSMLTRSQMMRSKRGMAQEATAFMSEPTLSANILMDAGLQFNMEKRKTGSAAVAWRRTGKYVTRAVAVYSFGQLAAALLEGLWDAWRDDDDEKFRNKFVSAFVENLALDLVPFNKIPILSDVFEAALAMFDVGFFSSDRMSTTWLSQAAVAVDAWKDVLDGKSSVTAYSALYKTMRAVSSCLGISLSGVMREGVALWNNTAGAYDVTWKVLTYDRSKAEKGELLLDSLIDGNDRQADSLKEQFADEAEYRSALRGAIKERFLDDELDPDDAIHYLVKYGGLDEDNAYWKVEEWKYEESTGAEFAKYGEFYEAVQTGKNLRVVVKKYTDNGVEPSTLASQITSHFKPIYMDMSKYERAGIKGYLLNAFERCGVDREIADSKIAHWVFEADHPELVDRITYTQYKRWEADGKPNGVSVEMYTDVARFRDDGTSAGVKSQEDVGTYIMSVTNDNALRDALWCCFYKASTLEKAPWH